MDTIKGQIKMEQKRIQRLIDLTDLTSAQAPPSALRNTAVPTLLPVLLPQLPLRLQAAPASPRVSSTAVLPPTRLPNGGCSCHAPGRSSAAKAAAFKDGRRQAAHQQKRRPEPGTPTRSAAEPTGITLSALSLISCLLLLLRGSIIRADHPQNRVQRQTRHLRDFFR